MTELATNHRRLRSSPFSQDELSWDSARPSLPSPHSVRSLRLNSLFSCIHSRPWALRSKHCLGFVRYRWACLGQSSVNICWMARWMDRHRINEQVNSEALSSRWKKKSFCSFWSFIFHTATICTVALGNSQYNLIPSLVYRTQPRLHLFSKTQE